MAWDHFKYYTPIHHASFPWVICCKLPRIDINVKLMEPQNSTLDSSYLIYLIGLKTETQCVHKITSFKWSIKLKNLVMILFWYRWIKWEVLRFKIFAVYPDPNVPKSPKIVLDYLKWTKLKQSKTESNAKKTNQQKESKQSYNKIKANTKFAYVQKTSKELSKVRFENQTIDR